MLPALDPLHILALHCNQCPFLTLSVARLFEHCMSHKESSDCTLLQCQQCGIVATHRGILEEHTQAWHPSAPLSVRQISTTTVQAAGSHPGQDQQFARYGCQFCSYRSDDHLKIARHYLGVHNVTNVDLHAKAAAAEGLSDETGQQQRRHQPQQPSPLSAAAVQLVQLSAGAPQLQPALSSSSSVHTSSASSSAAAAVAAAAVTASTSPLSTILPTVTLIRQPMQQQQQLLIQPSAISMTTTTTVSSTTAARSASDDSGYEADPPLPLLSGVGKVELADDSEPTASGEEDLNDSEMITDNSLIMDSVASIRGSSILTMSLEPEFDERVPPMINANFKAFSGQATAVAPAAAVTAASTSTAASAAVATPCSVDSNDRSTPKPLSGNLTFHQATTASMASKSDKDKASLKMIPVESFGKRYEVLTRNLRLMGGRLLIGQRLDRGTLDFSCQCRFCRRVVKLSKPKAYKFKIHLRTCKERRKTQPDGTADDTDVDTDIATDNAQQLQQQSGAAAGEEDDDELLEDDGELVDTEQNSLLAPQVAPDRGGQAAAAKAEFSEADCKSPPSLGLALPAHEIPA